jgi:DNA-binding response OmpR family regulator
MNTERKPCIVVVEDDEDTLQYISILLKEEEYETILFNTGEQLLDYLHLRDDSSEDEDPGAMEKSTISRMVDLILLDIVLRKISGIEVCRRIKEDRLLKHIPVIMITGLPDSDEKQKGFHVGADDYITKPFSNEALLWRIRVMLRMRKLQIELVEKQKKSEIGKLSIAVAHELNNPLCVINGNLDLLLERKDVDEYTLKRLQNIKKMTLKMIEIIGKMNTLKEGYTTKSYAGLETMIDLSEDSSD